MKKLLWLALKAYGAACYHLSLHLPGAPGAYCLAGYHKALRTMLRVCKRNWYGRPFN